MRRNLCLIAALAFLVPSITGAETNIYHSRGSAGYANGWSYDGCVRTWIDVHFSEFQSQAPPGPPDETPSFRIHVSQYDQCESLDLVNATGQIVPAQGDVHMDGGLNSAHVSTTFQGFDFVSGTTVPFVVDLTWNGIGSPTRSRSFYSFNTPDYIFRSNFLGDGRDAEVSGSIVVGTTSLSLTPGQYHADLYSNVLGMIYVER